MIKGLRKESTVPLGRQPKPSYIKNEWLERYLNGTHGGWSPSEYAVWAKPNIQI